MGGTVLGQPGLVASVAEPVAEAGARVNGLP